MSDKRTELEALAKALVQHSGLRDLSFRQLAERVGIKSSSVHYYFPEKGDLTVVLIKQYSEAFDQRLQAVSKTASTLHDTLMAFVDLFEEVGVDNKFCLCGMLAAEIASLDDESRGLLKLFFKQSEDWLTCVFTQHQDHVASTLPPDRLAAVLMSGLEGALLLDRVHSLGRHLQAQRQLIANFVIA